MAHIPTALAVLLDILAEYRREWMNMAPPPCLHEGWSFEENGRVCPRCLQFMIDWGD